jgi:hypothetical protein
MSPVKFCSNKYESYKEDDKQKLVERCEYSIAIKKSCTVFKDKIRIDRCNQIKENVEKYNQMQNDYLNYSNIEL